jgi:hypothetical protein
MAMAKIEKKKYRLHIKLVLVYEQGKNIFMAKFKLNN